MARSDLCLESREIRSTEDIPIRTLPARVHKLTRAAPDVIIIDLKLPASERLQFLAGPPVSACSFSPANTWTFYSRKAGTARSRWPTHRMRTTFFNCMFGRYQAASSPDTSSKP